MKFLRIGDKKTLIGVSILLLLLGMASLWCYQQSRLNSAGNNLSVLQKNARLLSKAKKSLARSQKNHTDIERSITAVALKNSIIIQNFTPEHAELEVTLADSSFAQLINWLAELQREVGVSVKTIRIDAADDGAGVKGQNVCLAIPFQVDEENDHRS